LKPRSLKGFSEGEGDRHRKMKVTVVQEGVVHIRNFVSIHDQNAIIESVQKEGQYENDGGFFTPRWEKGHLHWKMMCLGRHWNHSDNIYEAKRSNYDDLKAKPIPHYLLQFFTAMVQKVNTSTDVRFESCIPDFCQITFDERINHFLDLQQSRAEDPKAISMGYPIAIMAIGDALEILIANEKSDLTSGRKADRKIILNSGDVFLYGGESRLLYTYRSNIVTNSKPDGVALRNGCLALTFKVTKAGM